MYSKCMDFNVTEYEKPTDMKSGSTLQLVGFGVVKIHIYIYIYISHYSYLKGLLKYSLLSQVQTV